MVFNLYTYIYPSIHPISDGHLARYCQYVLSSQTTYFGMSIPIDPAIPIPRRTTESPTLHNERGTVHSSPTESTPGYPVPNSTLFSRNSCRVIYIVSTHKTPSLCNNNNKNHLYVCQVPNLFLLLVWSMHIQSLFLGRKD